MKRIFLWERVTSTGSVTGEVAAVTEKVIKLTGKADAEPAEATVKAQLPQRRHIRLDEDASRSTVVQWRELDVL